MTSRQNLATGKRRFEPSLPPQMNGSSPRLTHAPDRVLIDAEQRSYFGGRVRTSSVRGFQQFTFLPRLIVPVVNAITALLVPRYASPLHAVGCWHRLYPCRRPATGRAVDVVWIRDLVVVAVVLFVVVSFWKLEDRPTSEVHAAHVRLP
jgi:hypothetical protein